MSQDCPPLALDDLVHLTSPSPAPQSLDDSDIPPRTKSPSPSPLPESNILQMRSKVVEMCNISKSDFPLTPRETELTEMVLKLTAMIGPDPDQLLRQAETISVLTRQRDLLLHQAEEQRLRWISEKDSWARMAEALLAHQAKNRLNAEQDELLQDSDRLHAAEADSKGLRQRLNETQSRLQMLESELTRLRPLLLMQPLISHSSILPPTPNPKGQYSRKRKKDATATEDDERGVSEEDGPVDFIDTPSHTSHSQATPRPKPRKSEASNILHPLTNPHKRRPSQKASSRGLSADARVEHLLLAARKIGKHRAGIISGMVQYMEEQERERERKQEESAVATVATTPKTPKRNTSNMANTGYPSEGRYVYLNGQTRPGPGIQPVPLFIPAYPHHLLQTPSSSTTVPSVISSAQQSAQKSKQDARTNNPPTPLDSLLSAARSMMHESIEVDEDEELGAIDDSPAQMTNTRRARSKGALGSPVPRRRKAVARSDKPTTLQGLANRAADNARPSSVDASGVTNAGPGRVKSALDVLADQAAAFSTQEQSSQIQTQLQAKGKGKERAIDTRLQDPFSSTTKSRARTRTRRPGTEVDITASSTAPTSRSSTPRTDLGDNLTGSMYTTQPCIGGSAAEAPVDPGGGTGSADSSNSSSQTLDSISVPDGNQTTVNNHVSGSRLPGTSLDVDDSVDVTPRQGSRKQSIVDEEGKEGLDRTHAAIVAQPNLAPSPPPETERCERPPSPQRSEVMSSGGGMDSGSVPTTSTVPAKNKVLAQVVEQDMATPIVKRQRSPYVKWSKEEDDLLAQAVAKYGQKWDLVQRALPSRGYHQVRQRWLRKLGVFDSKPDLSSFQTAVTTFPSAPRGDGVEPKGNPKLGLAPLSSERAFAGLVGRPPSLPF